MLIRQGRQSVLEMSMICKQKKTTTLWQQKICAFEAASSCAQPKKKCQTVLGRGMISQFPRFKKSLLSGGFCQLVQLCSVAQQYLASNTMVHGNFCCPKFQNQSVFNRCYRVIWTPGLCLLTYRVSSALNSSNNYSKSCGELSLLKAGSDKIIYWLGRYSFLLGFIMSKKCERLRNAYWTCFWI